MLRPGQFLRGRYKVLKPIQTGGFGSVWLANDDSLGIKVALKETLHLSAEALRLFEQEAKILARLRHSHLPRVTDYFSEGGTYFLVMDFIEGENLEILVGRRVLKIEEIISWIVKILDALAYLHTPERNGLGVVVHRDVKPANIIIDASEEPFLVDFGIAKLSDLRGRGTMLFAKDSGTLGFAPPEQYAGHTEPRSDLYSLGATLYYLLTRQVPPESVNRQAGRKLPSLTGCRRDVSSRLEKVVFCAMELEVERRFKTAEEMESALVALAGIKINHQDKIGLPKTGPIPTTTRRDIRKI